MTIVLQERIPCNFDDVVIASDHINEDLLLRNLPEGFLPVDPSLVLLTVDRGSYSEGQDASKFRTWEKYFDAYVLELIKEPLAWWSEQNEENEE